MTYEKLQDLIEINRTELIDIIESEGCYTSNAVQFAIEEYTLGMECTEYSYHNYKEHFIKRNLKSPNGSYKFGHLMTEVLEHLFTQQIGPAYVQIKTNVYKYMDECKKNEELWNPNYVATFDEWCGYTMDIICSDKKFAYDWNKIKKNKK